MAEYIPEFLNEVTRIVVTTRNDNPSVEEYDRGVLPAWARCQAIQAAAKEGQRTPRLEEMAEVAQQVLIILRVKWVPEDEIRDRFADAFARCEKGAYPVDRAYIERVLWLGGEVTTTETRATSG